MVKMLQPLDSTYTLSLEISLVLGGFIHFHSLNTTIHEWFTNAYSSAIRLSTSTPFLHFQYYQTQLLSNVKSETGKSKSKLLSPTSTPRKNKKKQKNSFLWIFFSSVNVNFFQLLSPKPHICLMTLPLLHSKSICQQILWDLPLK